MPGPFVYAIADSSVLGSLIPASSRASDTTSNQSASLPKASGKESKGMRLTSSMCSWWWRAVSRGWKPSPGGVMYVLRGFATTAPDSLTFNPAVTDPFSTTSG